MEIARKSQVLGNEAVMFRRTSIKKLVGPLVTLLLLVLGFLAWHRRVVTIRNQTTLLLDATVSLSGKGATSIQLQADVRRTVRIFAIPRHGEESAIVIAGKDGKGRSFEVSCGYETLDLSNDYLIILNESASGEVRMAACEKIGLMYQWLSQ